MIFTTEILVFIAAIILLTLATAHLVERQDRMNTRAHDDHNEKLEANR